MRKITYKNLWDEIRSLLALVVLGLSYKIAPKNEKSFYLKSLALCTNKVANLTQLSALKQDALPKSINTYHAKRFWNICVEVGVDPEKVLDSEIAMAIARQFVHGEIDEVQLMRCLRNLSILNGGELGIQH